VHASESAAIGANPLQVSEAEKQAEVQRFLDG